MRMSTDKHGRNTKNKKKKWNNYEWKNEYEKRKVEELRKKGEEGGKQWYRYLRGDKNVKDGVTELVVNGKKVNKKKEIAAAVKVFWESMSNMNEDKQIESKFVLQMNTKQLCAMNDELQRDKAEKVLKCLENWKSTGIDGVPYEMYKYAGNKVVNMSLKLYEGKKECQKDGWK